MLRIRTQVTMSARLKRNWHLLKVLSQFKKPIQRKAILLTNSDDLILAICEIVDNVLRGTVQLKARDRKKLQQYKKVMRELANRKIAKKAKKSILLQKGGFLPLVLAPALSLVASLVGEAISSAIRH